MKPKIKYIKKEISVIIKGIDLIKEYLGKQYLLLKIIVSTLRVITPYISIYASGGIITALIENKNYVIIIQYAVVSVVFVLFLELLSRIANRKCLIMLNSCSYKHEALLSKKALSLDYAKSESSTVSTLRSKISENARSCGTGVIWLAECLGNIVSNIFSLIIAFVMISSMFSSCLSICHNKLSQLINSPFFSVAFFLYIMIFIIWIVYANGKNSSLKLRANNDFCSVLPKLDYYTEKALNENEYGKDIRIFNEKNFILNEIEKTIIYPLQKSQNIIFKSEVSHGSTSVVITALLSGSVYLFVGLKALSGALGAGKVVEYYGVITKLIQTFSALATEFGYLKINNQYLKQELEYLNLTSDMTYGNKTLEDIDLNKLEIEFHSVSFKYPKTENYILKDLSFKISKGEKLAIVGMNGSGKTTMIKLLCRLYDPTSGFISINGIDIKEFQRVEYIKLFAIVFQDFKLLAFSVGENIACNETYDEEKVWDCLEKSGLKDRVEKFPKKLNQPIYNLYEKDGIDISVGEEQKIAIARALYKNAPFVILDEPTSSLDPISESEIYTRFNDIIKNKTAIYISHRLSSCKFCSRILVFECGSIVQQGTHEELLSDKSKSYHRLWTAQSKYYTSNTYI